MILNLQMYLNQVPVNVGSLAATSNFGNAVYGTSTYGAVTLPSKRMIVTGSGFSNNFRFFSNDTNAAYAVNGLFVSFIAGGRKIIWQVM